MPHLGLLLLLLLLHINVVVGVDVGESAESSCSDRKYSHSYSAFVPFGLITRTGTGREGHAS
jgi:hypothetical protein